MLFSSDSHLHSLPLLQRKRRATIVNWRASHSFLPAIYSMHLLLAIATAVTLVAAAPRQHWTRQHKSFESIDSEKVSGWKYVSRPNPSQYIDLKIALREGGDIYEHLFEISDPDHHRYGNHVSFGSASMFKRSSCHRLSRSHVLISSLKRKSMKLQLLAKKRSSWYISGSCLTEWTMLTSTATGSMFEYRYR